MGTAVAADGGTLRLVSADPDTGEVTVALSGSCSTCSVASATLEAGVERILRERLPWVTEIVGIVDSADDWEASAALGRGGWRPAERS
jgi:Fe-S cluster biogenesis protein NfuA